MPSHIEGVYGTDNVYAYTTLAGWMISSEGPSPLGTRTYYYNNTFLNLRDVSAAVYISCCMQGPTNTSGLFVVVVVLLLSLTLLLLLPLILLD